MRPDAPGTLLHTTQLDEMVAKFGFAMDCSSTPNPNRLGPGELCDEQGCWPGLFIIGAQKAATTAVAYTLDMCNCVSFAENAPGAIKVTEVPGGSKETDALAAFMLPDGQFAHSPLPEQRAAYTRLYKRDPHSSEVAKRDGLFLDASVSYLIPEFAQTFGRPGFVPPTILPKLRFVAILREPLSRALSWYNHVLADFAVLADGHVGEPDWALHGFNANTSFHSTTTWLNPTGTSSMIETGKYINQLRYAVSVCWVWVRRGEWLAWDMTTASSRKSPHPTALGCAGRGSRWYQGVSSLSSTSMTCSTILPTSSA